MSQVVTASNPAELVRDELARVEQVLQEVSESEVEVLREAALHILGAGGKRVRPVLTLLTASAFGGSMERAIPIAAACELVHTATLVHDDIVDDSDSRRGRMSVKYYFGNSASVLMGDFLVVRAFGLLAEDPDRRLWRLLSDTIARMCEGEVLQLCVKGDTSIGVDVYEAIIECKTAVLMAACTQFGAALGGVAPEVEQSLAEYGRSLGMAFQIQDDILDFIGTPENLGKPVGGDLRESKVTLPVIYALQAASETDRQELLRIYDKAAPLTTAEVQRATEIIDFSGGFIRAREHALDYVRRAKENLSAMPKDEIYHALMALADRIVDRQQ